MKVTCSSQRVRLWRYIQTDKGVHDDLTVSAEWDKTSRMLQCHLNH